MPGGTSKGRWKQHISVCRELVRTGRRAGGRGTGQGAQVARRGHVGRLQGSGTGRVRGECGGRAGSGNGEEEGLQMWGDMLPPSPIPPAEASWALRA